MREPIEAVKLKEFVRHEKPGGCRMMSLGNECVCPLCLVDTLSSEIARLTAERDRLRNLAEVVETYVDALITDNGPYHIEAHAAITKALEAAEGGDTDEQD